MAGGNKGALRARLPPLPSGHHLPAIGRWMRRPPQPCPAEGVRTGQQPRRPGEDAVTHASDCGSGGLIAGAARQGGQNPAPQRGAPPGREAARSQENPSHSSFTELHRMTVVIERSWTGPLFYWEVAREAKAGFLSASGNPWRIRTYAFIAWVVDHSNRDRKQ